MKKLLTLILGVVLFSGAAYAKIYWLPNYLQDNIDRSAGRVTEDTTNRTAGCSKGGYYNSPLGSGTVHGLFMPIRPVIPARLNRAPRDKKLLDERF